MAVPLNVRAFALSLVFLVAFLGIWELATPAAKSAGQLPSMNY